jgi:uncharacterized membrane protein
VRGALRIALAFVGALPWLSALGAPSLPTSLKRAIDLAFAGLCHHVPERTLVIHAEAMCVCSRCAGVYAGIALAALGSGLLWRGETRLLRVALAASLAFMMADIVTQDLGLHAPWHAARLLTGALVGGSAAAWTLAGCGWTRRSRPSSYSPSAVCGEALPR